jgi:hypothetical protein
MNTDGTSPAAGPDWSAVRRDFLRKELSYAAICEKHGISREAFDERRAAEGWKRKNKAKAESTRATIRRLKELLRKRLADLETQLAAIGEDVSAAESEREIKSMNTLVRTLEKVLELERRHKVSGQRRNGLRIIDNARREELARRIAALAGSWRGSGDAGPVDAG